MNIHIGEEIKKAIDSKGWSIKKFSENASMSYRTALYLFERSDISVEQLIRLGKLLEVDFMQLFRTDTPDDMQKDVPKKKDYITMNFSMIIGGKQSNYDRFPELIRKTRSIAEDLGFELL